MLAQLGTASARLSPTRPNALWATAVVTVCCGAGVCAEFGKGLRALIPGGEA